MHVRWLVAVAVLTFLGCPGSLKDPERFLDGGDLVDQPDAGVVACSANATVALLASSCGGAGCHGGNAPLLGLDLESPNVSTRLTGVSACQNKSTRAFLLEKLAPNPTCGAPMPLGRAPWSDPEVACLEVWLGTLDAGL